jgi:hypothetical protein
VHKVTYYQEEVHVVLCCKFIDIFTLNGLEMTRVYTHVGMQYIYLIICIDQKVMNTSSYAEGASLKQPTSGENEKDFGFNRDTF